MMARLSPSENGFMAGSHEFLLSHLSPKPVPTDRIIKLPPSDEEISAIFTESLPSLRINNEIRNAILLGLTKGASILSSTFIINTVTNYVEPSSYYDAYFMAKQLYSSEKKGREL